MSRGVPSSSRKQADLAYDYLDLRGLQEQLRILKENRATAQRTLDLAWERQHVGLVTELDVTSAQRQLDTTTAQIAQMEQARHAADQRHQPVIGFAARLSR